jgi:hypothetical protein
MRGGWVLENDQLRAALILADQLMDRPAGLS